MGDGRYSNGTFVAKKRKKPGLGVVGEDGQQYSNALFLAKKLSFQGVCWAGEDLTATTFVAQITRLDLSGEKVRKANCIFFSAGQCSFSVLFFQCARYYKCN